MHSYFPKAVYCYFPITPSTIKELLNQRNITLSPVKWVKAIAKLSDIPEGSVYVHAKIDNLVWTGRTLGILPNANDGALYYGIAEQTYYKPEDILVFQYPF